MSKACYTGVSGTARKAKKMYVGVDGIARKVKKGYVGVNDVARLFYVSRYFEYTGEYTEQNVTINDVNYILYTLTSSGTLTCSEAQYWMCGPGSGGESASRTMASFSSGNGGNSGKTTSGELADGVFTVIIGAGGNSDADGGETSIADSAVTRTASGGVLNGDGGSGGGSGATCKPYTSNIEFKTPGVGDGLTKYPFGATSLKAHCGAGAGGGLYYYYNESEWSGVGGDGGSNGSSGESSYVVDVETFNGGTGGAVGGGDGGTPTRNTTVLNGQNATFYGSAGGGGAMFGATAATTYMGAGGVGYQGVVHILQVAQ